jgi:hypothetical protein
MSGYAGGDYEVQQEAAEDEQQQGDQQDKEQHQQTKGRKTDNLWQRG